MTDSAKSPYTVKVLETNGIDIVAPWITGQYGRFLLGTAGMRADLAKPVQSLNGWRCKVRNPQSVPGFLFSEDGFYNGREVIPIPPGKEVEVECGLEDATPTAYIWDAKADWLPARDWSVYTPTAAWTTATPTGLTGEDNVRFKYRDGICAIHGEISGTDGAGCTNYTFALPEGVIPYYAQGILPFEAWITVDGAKTSGLGYLDLTQSTGENRLLKFAAPVTLTDNKAFTIEFNLWFEVDGSFTTYTTTIAETAGPAEPTQVARYKIIDNMVYGYILLSDTDGAGSTAATLTVPVPIKDWDIKLPMAGIELVDTTYSDPLAYIDATQAAVANRLIKHNAFSTWTDNVAIKMGYAFAYPIFGETAYDLSATGVTTWASTALTPAAWTAADVSKYVVDMFDRIWWAGYWTSADGNAASSVTIKPPCPPRKGAGRIQVIAHTLVNATWSDAGGYLDADETDPDDRLLNFHGLPTFTNAQAAAMAFCAVYPI